MHTDPAAPLNTDILDRYLAGHATAEDRSMVEVWLAADPARKALLDRLERAGQPAGDAHTSTQWATLLERMQAAEVETPTAKPLEEELPSRRRPDVASSLRGTLLRSPVSRKRTLRQRVSYALMGLGVVVGGFFIVQRVPKPTVSHAERRYVTGVGERVAITLADGSRVTLAPRSVLSIPGTFGSGARMITLVGEAFFAVRTATGTPFSVRTGHVVTQVLGTTFDIQRYPSDATVRVIVISGRVQTKNRRGSTVLSFGAISHVSDSTITTATTSDAATYTSWTMGDLTFKNTPVPSMLATVGRWYGYEFRVADSTLAGRRVTAAFHVDDREKTLRAIKYLLGATMTFDGAVVTVRLQQASTATPRRREPMSPLTLIREAGK